VKGLDATLRSLPLDMPRPRWWRRGAGRPVSFFEFWPGWLFYAPVVLQWIWLGLRYGDFSLPTAANPRIATGGLCGESKTSILDQIGAEQRHWTAPYILFQVGENPPRDAAAAERAIAEAGLAYPLVVKPDIGCNGTGVRFLAGADDLARYLREFPPHLAIVLQSFVRDEGEAGLFYIRRPGEARGQLTSLTLKSSPVLIGDGRTSLRDLILADPRAGYVPQLYLPRLAARLDEVPASGEAVRLVFVGNHCKGSTFENGGEHITDELTDCIDRIARSIPDFHFGRFDVRFRSVAELRRGTGFTIIEVNGVGSEATHIWDPRTTLPQAYAAQFFHYRAAFEIGRSNRAAGHATSGLMETLRLWRLQRRVMAAYPMND